MDRETFPWASFSKEGESLKTLVGIILAFPLGIWVGYAWRDRISRRRRARYLAERFERGISAAREREAAEAALATIITPSSV
jgi:hypothetical protein